MVKNIFIALIKAFLTSIILLLIFAMVMYFGGLEEKAIGIMVVITYLVSNLIGGLSIGISVMKRKYLWGIITGILYFVFIYMISLIGSKNGMNINTSVIIALFISVTGGMIGGMIS